MGNRRRRIMKLISIHPESLNEVEKEERFRKKEGRGEEEGRKNGSGRDHKQKSDHKGEM